SMRRLCLRNVLGSLRNRSSSAMAGVLSWQAAGEHRRPGMRLPRPVAPDYTLVMANRGTSAPRWHGFSHGREGVVGSGQRAKGRAPSGMAGPFPQAPHQAAPLKVDALAGQEVRRAKKKGEKRAKKGSGAGRKRGREPQRQPVFAAPDPFSGLDLTGPP